jgi:membrane peptidoglycan carboxypeptidase
VPLSSSTQIIRRRRNRRERRAVSENHSRTWNIFILLFLFLLIGVPLIGFFGMAGIVYAQSAGSLPAPMDTIDFSATEGVTRLYARDGQTLLFAVEDPLGDERTYIRLDELPPYVAQATLLVEDEDFLSAPRENMSGTLVRLWRNFLSGPVEADTSLTGRLVRNTILSQPEFVTADDRSQEIALVSAINQRYTPQEILEWHLNTNDYGNEAFGIEAAAQVYLGKSARDLTLDEAALLTSIPTAPQYNPVDNKTAALSRQSDTLRRMLLAGFITQQQHDESSRIETVLLPNAGQTPEIAPEFSIYARRQTEDILNSIGLNGDRLVSRGGLTVTTTLDIDLYYQAECTLRTHLVRLAGNSEAITALDGSPCTAADNLPVVDSQNASAGAASAESPYTGMITVIDVQTGEIKALAGNATQSAYQPGVTLYPFVYFEGFRPSSQKTFFTPATMLLDVPRPYPGQVEGLIYQPVNADGVYRGPISLRESAGRGLLTGVVQIAQLQGMSNVLSSAHTLGINSLDGGPYHLSLLDNGGEVALLDVAYAYSVFASMGDMYGIPARARDTGYRQLDPVAVTRIIDSDGQVLWEYQPNVPNVSQQNIFSDFPELGYLVNSVLSNDELRAEQYGQDNPLNLDRTAAVVNGMTSNRVENWTVGYTPQRVVGVHIGHEDGSALDFDSDALQGAAPVWNALMEYVHQRDAIPPTEWTRPPDIVELEVCQMSGLLPNGVCPVYEELFIQGVTPTQRDTYWQSFTVNSQNGLLASPSTPDALRDTREYFVPPDTALDWWNTNRRPLPPMNYDAFYAGNIVDSASITSPAQYSYVKGVIDVIGTINPDNMQSYQLAYGQTVAPESWINISEAQTTYDPENPVLGQWDTSMLDGLYTLQLNVVLQSGVIERVTTQVRVDNTPPTIILTTAEPGRIYRFPDDAAVVITADVRDSFIDRVEFSHDGRLVFTDTDAPFEYEFPITGVGTEFFSAVAFDEADNRTESQEISIEIRR